MTKKEYLEDVLPKLAPYWDYADTLLTKIQADELNEKQIDFWYDSISKEIDDVQKGKQQDKLSQNQGFLQSLKDKEKQAREQEEAELQELEKMMGQD